MDRKSGIRRNCLIGILVLLGMVFNAFGLTEDMNKCDSTRKMDLVIIMDGTISLGYRGFRLQKEFVEAILSKMKFGPRNTQLGVIQFSDKWSTAVEMEMGIHGRREAVLKNVSAIKYQQGRRTLTGMALLSAYEQFFSRKSRARPGVDKVLLLITDGPPKDEEILKKVVKDLKEKHVRIVTVATGTRNSYIQGFRYVVRSIASGFPQGFKAEHLKLKRLVADVAKEICKSVSTQTPTIDKIELKQRCFQEKKDIVFALDGSNEVDSDTFNNALSLVSQICADLDISPSLIHVGLLQYSDQINTRFEFALNQYTKYHQINESLKNIFQSKGRRSDLENALRIIDEKVFIGLNGDRISAEDYLLLFMNGATNPNDQVLKQIQKLKDKGVHVIIVGMGKPRQSVEEYFEKLASHPNDVNYLDTVKLKNIVGDLTAITCRKVNCPNHEAGKKDKREDDKLSACQQTPQDVLFMLDSTITMSANDRFRKAKKMLTRVVKRLNIAATTTHVGLMTFGRYRKTINFELGKYTFEALINRNILRTRQMHSRDTRADIAGALRFVNKQIFNTSSGGHREDANDLIVVVTRGNAIRNSRLEIQKQVAILKAKGVRIAVLNAGYKKPILSFDNTARDIASGARDVYPLDSRRASTITQALMDVECKVQQKTVSPQCFGRSRRILFMLDSSRGLGYKELPVVRDFIQDIVEKLYTYPSDIEIGLMHYSDMRTATYSLRIRKRSKEEVTAAIQSFWYRRGSRNYLGDAFKTVRKMFDKRPREANADRIIVLLARNQPADPEKAFTNSEKLRSMGIQIVTVVIHIAKTPIRLNPQYRALATSRASSHSFDLNNLKTSSIDVVLNLCELNTCPQDSTKDCTPRKQDIFMIIDSSRSIGVRVYPHLRRFVRRLVNKLDISNEQTHLGILQASDSRKTQYEMKLGEITDLKDIESVINEMSYHQGYTSNIGRGLVKAMGDNLFNGSDNAIPNVFFSNSDRADAENVLMVYSDGIFHDAKLAKENVARLKQRGVRVVVVGLGRESRKPRAKLLLESIATSRSDVYLVNLNKASLLVEEELNEVAQHVTTLQCHDMYPAPIECSPESLDLFIVVDGSRSVGYANFGKVQNFLKKLANEFSIGKDQAHFGVMQFGAEIETRVEFNLNDYQSNKEVTKAISEMTFLNSRRTGTGHALSVVNKQIFSGKNGDRPNVPNILILFTDGSAHDKKTAFLEAEELKKRGTRIVAIAAGKDVNKFFGEVKRFASTKEDAHKSDFDKLSGIVDDLLDVVCQ